jgi:hypothetical protein
MITPPPSAFRPALPRTPLSPQRQRPARQLLLPLSPVGDVTAQHQPIELVVAGNPQVQQLVSEFRCRNLVVVQYIMRGSENQCNVCSIKVQRSGAIYL